MADQASVAHKNRYVLAANCLAIGLPLNWALLHSDLKPDSWAVMVAMPAHPLFNMHEPRFGDSLTGRTRLAWLACFTVLWINACAAAFLPGSKWLARFCAVAVPLAGRFVFRWIRTTGS
jgi:hypothetical protein